MIVLYPFHLKDKFDILKCMKNCKNFLNDSSQLSETKFFQPKLHSIKCQPSFIADFKDGT
jgi:hypothetical protein